MNTASQTGDYLEEPGSTATESDTFQGKRLAPFSLGVRELWVGFTEATDSRPFMAACMVWLLLKMQEAFDVAANAGNDMENCAYYASRTAMELVKADRRLDSRVRVKLFLDDLKTQASLTEICRVSAEILGRAEKNEPESVESEEAGDNLGKRKRGNRRSRAKP